MKKKFLSLFLASCMALPCAFMLSACNEECTAHNLTLQSQPTVVQTGELFCGECMKKVELPVLNETDYTADVTNPDHKIYTYTVDGQSFKFYASNFGFTFDWTNRTAFICRYSGNSTDVVIPEVYGQYAGQNYTEYNVVGIDYLGDSDTAFMNNTTITSVTFNSNATTIGSLSFSGCTNLKKIVFNSTDVTVDYDAFNKCTNLESVFYKGTQEQWGNVSIHNQNNEHFKNASLYYYSETKPTGLDYLNDNKTWHYDENNNHVAWDVNFTNHADGKTFGYSHSEVELSDEYWTMLKTAEAQDRLGDLLDNDQTQIEMVTSSTTKEEYQTKFAAWYATSSSAQTIISFAENKVTLSLNENSMQMDYIEVDGEIYSVSGKEKMFAYDTANNTVYEEKSTPMYTVRHVYSITE